MPMSFTKGVDIGSTEQDVSNTKHHNLVDLATSNGDGDRSNTAQSSSFVYVSTSAPTANPVPINGHLWYDSTNDVLMEYDGADWVPVSRGTLLINRSGGTLSAGDVVVIDTGNAQSCDTSTTANDTDVIGVVLVGGDDTDKLVVITEGHVPAVTVASATAIGDYLFNHTVAGEAEPDSTLAAGAFGRAMSSTAGAGSVTAVLGTVSIQAASNNEIEFTASAAFSGSQAHSSTGTQTVNHSLGILPKMITISFHRTGGSNAGSGSGSVFIAADGTIAQSVVAMSDNVGGGNGVRLEGYAFMYVTNSTNYARGVISNITTTQFDITWSNVGSPTAATTHYVGVCYG